MPIFGELDVDRVLYKAPLVTSFATQPWNLPDARLVQVAFEVAHRPALELTPPSLHPSVPPYATVSMIRCPEGPLGPFTLAQLRLVVRAGIRPRALLLGAYCDAPPVAAALREQWGFDVHVADVKLLSRHDSVRGTVVLDGDTILEMESADNEPVGLGDLTLLDNLHLIRLLEGDATEPVGAIVQVDPEFTVHSADRGQPVLRAFDPDAFGGRGLLVLTSPVTAIVCSADIDLPRPRFAIDPHRPAIQSSRKLALSR